MRWYQYHFSLTMAANPYNTHALTTHLLGKNSANFSVWFYNQKIMLRTTEELNLVDGRLVIKYSKLNALTVVANLTDRELIEPTFQQNDNVTIDGVFSLERKQSQIISCPVWKDGYDEAYLQKIFSAAGLTLIEILEAKPGLAERRGRVWIHNIVHLEAKAKIENLSRFHRTMIQGIGRRKSYGFGQLRVKPPSSSNATL